MVLDHSCFVAFLQRRMTRTSRLDVEIRCAPSKEEAEQKCPNAWSGMVAVFELLKQSLPEGIATIVPGHYYLRG